MRTFLTAFVLASGLFAPISAMADHSPSHATLYKTPECGCCENYGDYLRENGFEVTVVPTPDLATMSRDAGLSDEFSGCHLTYIDGYVVSGHVPISTVERLLSERPDIKGVTLPGMPMGSPGMGGAKTEAFTIYEIGGAAPEVYAVE